MARYIFIDGGVGTICVGIYAAVFEVNTIVCMQACYDGVCLYNWLDCHTDGFRSSRAGGSCSCHWSRNANCEKIAYMMVDNARNHSILYGINCFLDCAGAVPRCIKQLFDYEQIETSRRRFRRPIITFKSFSLYQLCTSHLVHAFCGLECFVPQKALPRSS